MNILGKVAEGDILSPVYSAEFRTLYRNSAVRLWFASLVVYKRSPENQAEEAARFYTSVFKNSKMGSISRYGEAGAQASGRPKGSTMTVEFELAGQKFLGLNGGPEWTVLADAGP